MAVVLLLASAFYKNPKITQQKMVYFFPILIMVLFIFKQPNLSMVILLGLTSLIMWLSAGGPLKLAFTTIFGGIGFVAFLYKIVIKRQFSYIICVLNILFHVIFEI